MQKIKIKIKIKMVCYYMFSHMALRVLTSCNFDVGREVNKAFCGFLNHPHYQTQECDSNAGVATGNWGCGVFGGDPEIKSILQWLAASQVSFTLQLVFRVRILGS